MHCKVLWKFILSDFFKYFVIGGNKFVESGVYGLVPNEFNALNVFFSNGFSNKCYVIEQKR